MREDSLSDEFVRVDDGRMVVGKTRFRGTGTNLYYLQQLFSYAAEGIGAEEHERQALAALDDARALSFNVVRLWAFNDSDDPAGIRPEPGAYREAGLSGLDRAVAEAKARGLRVILTLVNNWDDYGGLAAYARWAGDPTVRDDFFSPRGSSLRDYWKDYVSVLGERTNTVTGIAYRDEPAILAWEIANEFRCRGCQGTARLVDTLAELARHLRATFPRHLIADGGEGFDDDPARYPGLSNTYPVRGEEGTSFRAIIDVPEIDLASYHLHPTSWGLDEGNDAVVWIQRHEALAAEAGKVAYLGEFASRSEPASDASRAMLFDTWLATTYDAADGSMALLWQLVVEGRHDDGLGVLVRQHQQTAATLKRWGSAVR